MKIRSTLAITLLFSSLSAKALDTVEPFSPGVSDLEAYVSGSDGDYATDLVVGAGYGTYLNPAFNATLSSADPVFTLSNMSNLYSGVVDFDVIAGLSLSGGNLAYAVDTETTHVLNEKFTPYVQTSYAFTTEGEYADELTANLGTIYNVQEGHELLVQASVLVNDGSTWGAGLGYNFLVRDDVEVVTELSSSGDDVAFSVGAIWSL
jgi:hypothetical protein